jgi:hypothetical protein
LRESDGRCPECGRVFVRGDPGSYAAAPPPWWRGLVLKAAVACDSWWFYLANIIGLGIACLVFRERWFRVAMGIAAAWDLYLMIRRIRKGPSSSYEKMLRESASAARVYYISRRAMVGFACSFVLAMGLVGWDALRNRSPDTHPLQSDRLWLRLSGIFFMVVCFAIVGTVTFRALRATGRMRRSETGR